MTLGKKPRSNGAYEVGHCCPPKKHQFKKGQPSPNPLGRPKTPRDASSAGLTVQEAAILKASRKQIKATKAGKSVSLTLSQAAIEKLFAKALSGDVAALAKVFDMTQKAQIKDAQLKRELLDVAVRYKEKWDPIFYKCLHDGVPVPTQLPDPRDIEIKADGTVKITGPVTCEMKQALHELIKRRDLFIKFDEVAQILGIGLESTREEQAFLRARRRDVAQCNKHIPPRLRRECDSLEKLIQRYKARVGELSTILP